MQTSTDLLTSLSQHSKDLFKQRQIILSFSDYLKRIEANPYQLTRSSTQYLKDALDYFGKTPTEQGTKQPARWQAFDIGTERGVSIVGQEEVQQELYQILENFVRQGFSNKLIVLHGPNGSAKTSIVECLSHALERYSRCDEGAVYKFNWIFSTEKAMSPRAPGETGPIGFSGTRAESQVQSYAHLPESKISSKIHSEFKENPVFLLPQDQRIQWLEQTFTASPLSGNMPQHLKLPGLSKKNQLIYENLLAAYDGDITRVLSHVQVERFFYSRQYRVGVGTVEPQLSIDALEKQLTMDRNIANLPPVLHNISFYEASGPLIEANRGLLEFSDMLKRPTDAFKYLLSTVEKGTLNLPSSMANLDVTFIATTNEKHLDAFKTIPDFSSFRSRFELITVPYLLLPGREQNIYQKDLQIIERFKKVSPHVLRLLALWAVLTRLKQPNQEYYSSEYRSLVAKLDPLSKVKLLEGKSLTPTFNEEEEARLKEIQLDVRNETRDTVVYEGRFGASPREVRTILYRASQDESHETLTPMALFETLEKLVKDRSVYEFLQIEPRKTYHDVEAFIDIIRNDFHDTFVQEVRDSMVLIDDRQYQDLFIRYFDNTVATLKKEKLYNKITGGYEEPSERLMKDVEAILAVKDSTKEFRENLLRKIAAYRIDHPNEDLDVTKVFPDIVDKIRRHYYEERKKTVDQNLAIMLKYEQQDSSLTESERQRAETTYSELKSRYGYDRASAKACLKFMLSQQKKRESS